VSDTTILSPAKLKWCTRSVFWGSHGCTLGDHDGDIHECAVRANGDVSPCSQCRTLPDGVAEVRFWDWHKNAWGDWSKDWTWFTND
jgi:hypothetical protein